MVPSDENLASASAASAPGTAPPERPGFRARLHAWWEGYTIPAKLERRVVPKKTAASPPPAEPAAKTDPHWSPERILVGQMIWGDGFTFPGGGAFAADLAGALIVDKRSTVLDVGCGLGGGTRTIVQRYGAQAHGFDLSPALAKAGDAMSAKEGLDLRAPISALNLDTPGWKKQYYDAAMLRNVLSVVTDKVTLVRFVADALQRGGRFLLVDWALADEESHGADLGAYIEGEQSPPYLGTLAQMTFLVESAGFIVKSHDDITDQFRPIVLKGWSRIGTLVGDATLKPAEGKALMQEAQLWARRLAALQSGELRIIRIEALKKP